MKEYRELLNNVDVFFGLNEKERDLLLDGVEERDFRKKDFVCSAGSAADHMHVITRGAVKTMRGDNGGPRLLVDFVKEGEILGEEGVLLSGDYEMDACPFDHCSVLAIPVDNVARIMDGQPRLARALASLSATRARNYRDRLYQMNAIPVPVRLCGALQMLGKRFGKRDRQGTMIALKVTHQDLADYVGAARETVTLFLSRFKKEGIITMNVRRIIIPDMKALKKYTC